MNSKPCLLPQNKPCNVLVFSLVDFERKDDDELGFRKNDIIIVVNSKDEHCWVGELNGLRLVKSTSSLKMHMVIVVYLTEAGSLQSLSRFWTSVRNSIQLPEMIL